MDPLAQLKDIHLPDQIHHYPIAIGWWILIVIVIASIVISVIKIKHYKKIRRAKSKAITHVKQATSNQDIVSTLKWACLQYFPRETIAPLYGESFYGFLHTRIPSKQQENVSNTMKDPLNMSYQNNISEFDTEFQKAALLWLSLALPPKNKDKEPLDQHHLSKHQESH